MKKIISSILIVIVILQIFAPFSVGFENNKVEVVKNEAKASYPVLELKIFPEIINNNSIKVKADITLGKYGITDTKEGVIITLTNIDTNVIEKKEVSLSGSLWKKAADNLNQVGEVLFENLDPNGNYKMESKLRQFDVISFNLDWNKTIQINTDNLWGISESDWEVVKNNNSGNEVIIQTNIGKLSENKITQETGEEVNSSGQTAKSNSGPLPECRIDFWNTVGGCIGQALYWVFFRTTSFVFEFAGKALDFSLFYSISDSSYRSPFVVEGWGIVRDFCNMFFIFILLYVAIGTILNLHSVKTKEMIINVVIIGLLMNFSLFAVQIIIDSSNILTRVFYNTNTIVTGKTEKDPSTGKNIVKSEVGKFGEIQLSGAIITKVDPQLLITRASEISSIPQKGITKPTDPEIGTGSFIIIIFLTTFVNVIGIIVFLSCAIIFITRVIGLWLAMILVPLAFFSYTVPALSSMKMVGWTHWWPETLKLAFLAPVFAFFMYIIVGFMDKGLGVVSILFKQNSSGMDLIISIIVPFIFIMVLLWKAKSIANDMSGEIGQSITKGLSAVGGMALGGAALGVAAVGRGTIGAFMKGASTGDTTNQRFARGESRNGWDKFKGAVTHYGTGTLLTKAQQKVGTKINADQTKVEGSRHARHELDQAASARFNGKTFKELTQPERNTIREKISRDHEGKQRFGKEYTSLTAGQKLAVDAVVTPQLTTRTSHADHFITESLKKQGLISSVVQSSRNGSFDVRNLSKLVASDQDKGFNKFATGLTSALASGMRGTLKQSNINYGEGQKNFIKDLGNTITDALKSTSLKVDLSHVGEEKKEGHEKGGHH